MDKLMPLMPFLPLVLAILFGCSQLLMQVFVPSQRRNLLTYSALLEMAFLGLATVLAFSARNQIQSLPMAAQTAATQAFAFLDSSALFFYLLLICAGFVTVLGSAFYLEREQLVPGEFYALLFFALAGMMVLASGGDLMTLFVGLEIMSMAVYILVGYRRNELRSNEGSFKYFLLGSLASALLLYGIALTYGVTGTIEINEIQRFYLSQAMNPLGAIGMLFLLAGLAFKVAAVPFHSWAPDAYEGAPMPVTGFMATAVKVAAFALILKVFGQAFISVRSYWYEAVTVLAAITMLVGNLMAFTQQNFKRMLAYSSIVHTGYLLVGISALRFEAGMGGSSQVRAALLYYLFIYVISTLGVFLALTYLSSKGETLQRIDDYAGLAKARPFTALLLSLLLFSFIGLPPLGGFFAKFYLFSEAMRQQQGWLVAFAVFNSVLSIIYYLRPIIVMYMKPTDPVWLEAPQPQLRPTALTIVLAVMGVMTLWAGFAPINLLGLIPGLVPLVDWLRVATSF